MFNGLPPLGASSGPSQTMPTVQGPAQIHVAELRLKPHEIQLYESLFQMCDTNNNGLLTGSQIKNIMTKSKLNKNILAGIWTLADKQKRKALDRENWAVAMRLISLAQSGLPVSELGLKQYVDVPLPVFEQLQAPAALQQTPMQQQAPPQQQQHQQQQHTVPPSNHSSNSGVTQDWGMTNDERSQYAALFGQADEDQDGFVNAKEAKFFKESHLDNKILKQIWLLADQDKDNKLNHEEFNVAMHLTMKLRKGFTLPSVLPEALVINKKSSNNFDASSSHNSVGHSLFPSTTSSASNLDFAPVGQFRAPLSMDDFGPAPSMPMDNSMKFNNDGITPKVATTGTANASAIASANGAVVTPLTTSTNTTAQQQIQPTNFFPGGSAAAFLKAPGDEQDKWRELSRTLSTAQSSVSHQYDQLKGLADTLSLFNAKTRMLVEQLAKAGAEHAHVQQLILEEQAKIEAKKTEMAQLDNDNNGILSAIVTSRAELEAKKLEMKETQQKIIDAHTQIPSIKKETQEIEMQIAVIESQLQQMRQAWKQVEDTKNTQASILSARKDQAAKLLREKQEVQDMLDQATLELNKIKNEATVVKENIPIITQATADMRQDLKELREVLEEERKNPTARANVSINSQGQLTLDHQKTSGNNTAPALPVHKSIAPNAAASVSASALGLLEEDDDFSVPDIFPTSSILASPQHSQPPPPPRQPSLPSSTPPPALVSKSTASFTNPSPSSTSFVATNSVSLPSVASPSTAAAAVAAPSKSSSLSLFGDDDDDFSVPDIALPSLGTSTTTTNTLPAASNTSPASNAPKNTNPIAATSGFDDNFGDFDMPSTSAIQTNGHTHGNSAKAADPFGDSSSDPFASVAINASASKPFDMNSFDDFNSQDPFTTSTPSSSSASLSSSSFSSTAASAAAPAATTAKAVSIASPKSPPPPSSSVSPPPPKRVPSVVPTVVTPAANVVPSNSSFDDDDDWNLPSSLPGSENVKVPSSFEANADEWGF